MARSRSPTLRPYGVPAVVSSVASSLVKLIGFPSAVSGRGPPAVGARQHGMLPTGSHAEQGRAAQLTRTVTKTGPMACLPPSYRPSLSAALDPVTGPDNARHGNRPP